MSFLRLSALLIAFAASAFAQSPATSADLEFQHAIDLFRLHRIDEARQAFFAGQQHYSNDKRFPIELAGLAFQSKNNREAIQHLRRALRLDAKDQYANNFMASLYLLEGNLDAAVKYWNRVDKPRIRQITFEPPARTNAVLLDHNFAFSPASVLRLDDLRTTQARLEALQVFSSPQYSLQATPDGKFDFVVRASERNGVGNSKLQALIRLFRGLPYQTIYPEYFNAGGSATNFTSLLRWDSNKRRAAFTVSAPLQSRPSFHYTLSADFRDENWILSPTTPSAFRFHSRQFSLSASISQIVSGKWNWGVGTVLKHQHAPQLSADRTVTEGYSLQYFARVERQLLSIPEKRLTLAANLSPSLGRNFSGADSNFARLQGSTELTWLPGRKSGDYEFAARFSGGRSWGTLPFSELFELGIERDNNLLLRGHVGTRDGRKGSAPLARDYLLGNLQFTRRMFNNGLFDVKLGPFLDAARPYRALQTDVSNSWLYDPGIAVKIRVLGAATVTFFYARNLHDHRNAFYITALD